MNVLRITILLFVFSVAVSFAEDTNPLPDTITIDKITYSNVTWRTVTPATVSIFHSTGVAAIPLEKLPPDLQTRFGYNPQKAADYRAQEAAAAQQHLVEMQARELARQKAEADALATAQAAQVEQAKELVKANQKAIANVEIMQVLHVIGVISPLGSGNYTAQLALTNETRTVCARFDDSGRRYLDDVNRKFAQWKARQDSLEQQSQIQGQSLTLYGGRSSVRVMGYIPDNGATVPVTPPPASPLFAVREQGDCYSLRGGHEMMGTDGARMYSW